MKQNNKTYNRKLVDGITRRNIVTDKPVKNTFLSSQIKYSGLKALGVFTALVVIVLRLSAIGSTVSYYNEKETSVGNFLQAGNLSLVLSSNEDVLGRLAFTENSDVVLDEENVGSEQFSIGVSPGDESLPLIYEVFGEPDKGNEPGCEKLLFDANLGGYNYNGLFSGFNSGVMSETGEWIMMVHFPVDDPELSSDLVCKGNIVFRAGLGGVESDLTHTYSDEKRYSFELKNWESSTVTSFGVQSESLPPENPPPTEGDVSPTEDLEQKISDNQDPPDSEDPVVEEAVVPPPEVTESEII